MEKEEIELWEPYPGHFIAIRGEWDLDVTQGYGKTPEEAIEYLKDMES